MLMSFISHTGEPVPVLLWR